MLKHKFFLYLLLNLFLSNKFCKAQSNIDLLWSKYSQCNNNDQQAFVCLEQIANEYTKNNSYEKVDSCYRIIFNKLQLQENTQIVNEKYKQYFHFLDYNFSKKNFQFANDYLQAAKKLNNKENLFRANLALFYLTLETSMDSAEQFLQAAEYFSIPLKNNYFNTLTIIAQGKLNSEKNNKIIAYRNFLDAELLSNENNYTDLNLHVKYLIVHFLNQTKNFDKAKTECIKLINQHAVSNTNDSISYFRSMMWLSEILFNTNEDESAEYTANKVIQFAERNNTEQLKLEQLTILRSKYFEKNKLKKINDLYFQKFPDELNKIAITDSLTYYRILSVCNEYKNKMDSSFFYFQKAEKMLTENKSAIYLANFYRRFAQLNLRMNQASLAENYYTKCLNFATQAQYYPWILEAANNLDSLAEAKGDYKVAHAYQKIYVNNLEEYNLSQKSEEIVQLSFNNEQEQRMLEAKKAKEKMEKKHNLQYFIIVISLLICFLFLIILGSIKVPKFIVKGMGYISFIFLFELIILIADEKIHHITHGAPLYIMGIKIVLISFLLPFHHWIEHKVIHFLYEHRLINSSKFLLFFKNILQTLKEIYTPEKIETQPEIETNEKELNKQ